MITGGLLAGNEKIIVIDSLLVAPRFIANIDEAMAHFDYRAPITRDIGMTLGRFMDKNVARVTALAARASASVAAGFGGGSDAGSAIVSANSKTVADTLIQAIFDAVTALDQKNVPDTDRYTYLTPTQYNLLVNSSSKLINRDYGNEGNGSTASGVVLSVAGTEIVKSNNLPLVDDSANAAIPATYQGNFSTTTALVCHKEAVGTVKLVDLAVEMDYLIQNQGWLTLGKYAVGHGILRPECAVEIKTA